MKISWTTALLEDEDDKAKEGKKREGKGREEEGRRWDVVQISSQSSSLKASFRVV
jgi:hypothetical protein